MTETQPDRQDGDGLLRSALELKITDSKGHEVAEDSLHELRKAVRAYLTRPQPAPYAMREVLNAMILYARAVVKVVMDQSPDRTVPQHLDALLADAKAKSEAALSAPVLSPDGPPLDTLINCAVDLANNYEPSGAITTEQLDQLQFGRSLHDRPSPDGTVFSNMHEQIIKILKSKVRTTQIADNIEPAANALQDWFQSQDLEPFLAVLVAEMFIARMIAANGHSNVNIEQKFELTNQTIRDYTTFCLINKP